MIDSIHKYHLDQWSKEKESTKEFLKFFRSELSNANRILDLGSGAGAVTTYIAKEFLSTNFIGIDISPELINLAMVMSSKEKLKNLDFQIGDWLNCEFPCEDIDGVMSIATLSWLSEIVSPMTCLFSKVKPKWIALSSLFYEGDISCRIEVNEHKKNSTSFYNVYSIQELERLANKFHYKITRFQSFEIGIDIARPIDIDSMGTYTVRVEDFTREKRLQISGPLNMPWYFVLLTRG